MIVAATGWADASIAIAGIFFITAVICTALWQIFATGRSGMAASKEKAYRKLAEEATDAQQRTATALEKASTELADLRARTAELERLLKEVE